MWPLKTKEQQMSGNAEKESLPLGARAKDRITGFMGVLMARTTWMWGCDRYAIQPEALDKDGKTIEAEWFDDARIVLIDEPVISTGLPSDMKPGGPQKDPSRGREVG